ncbi:malate synthase A [uncultured Gammaproteobacteria bacterium]
MVATTIAGLTIIGPIHPEYHAILTPAALGFVAELGRRFDDERERLLHVRHQRQALIAAGEKPDFIEETAAIRAGQWTVAPQPHDLTDRRVEITGPVERKMIINALNSGANVFMADFEDSTTPTWHNLIHGQINLYDAIRRTISWHDPANGKNYRLNDQTAVLMVRPRGWHLPERHVTIDGKPISATLFDFGLYFHHNVKALLSGGTGPYFYLPKLESHFEARLWREVFVVAEQAYGLPNGTIKATVLIETIMAAFEMDEILYELRDHSAGLNCGRWDYIFSFIKKFHADPDALLPDRDQVTMASPFLDAYRQLAIKTCHRRNAPAIGGMAAFIPVKNDDEANAVALAKVREDKEREAAAGHDGTWVAHPALVPVALEVFNRHMPGPNQIHRKRAEVTVVAEDLLRVPEGVRTEAGLRRNVAVGLGYLESWLRGNGCVPLFNLMEDAATAEICRAQVWQWLHHRATLDDGRPISHGLVRQVVGEELEAWRGRVGTEAFTFGRFREASELFLELVESPDFTEFLTLPAYERLLVADG